MIHEFVSFNVDDRANIIFPEQKIKIITDFIECIVLILEQKKNLSKSSPLIYAKYEKTCKNFVFLKEQIINAINGKNYSVLTAIISFFKNFGRLVISPFYDQKNFKLHLKSALHPLKFKQKNDFEAGLKELKKSLELYDSKDKNNNIRN